MHQIRIKPNEQRGPVRVEATLHNTSRGEVQRFKYFPSPDKSSSLESTAKDDGLDIHTTQSDTELVDQYDEPIPLHNWTKGKVSQKSFHIASCSISK